MIYTNEADSRKDTKTTKRCTLSHAFLPFCYSAEFSNHLQGLRDVNNELLNAHSISINSKYNGG